MLKATWRRLGSPAWLATGLVLLLPTLAQAQLFPNRTIRRERPPCASEPPFNGIVRHDYFGYYPTCWSRFPAGWDCPCPNPEKPNATESIRLYGEIGQRKPIFAPGAGPGMDDTDPDAPRDRNPANPAGDGPIPLPNGGRSPFELDSNPKPPTTPPNADPFEPKPNTAPTPPNPGATGRPSNSTGLMEMPRLPATTPTTSFESPLQPGGMAVAPEATLASGSSADSRPDLGPLPSSPVSIPNNLPNPSDPTYQPFPTPTAPAQAPRRRVGFLGSLFGQRNTQNR